MIRSFQKNKALTLTELLISSALIAVIMIGVTSFAVSVKGYHETTNIITNLSMRATATMAMIKKDASQAIGDASDPGILCVHETTGGKNGAAICFRLDDDDDPTSYANDHWYCYTQDSSYDLHRCGPLTNGENPLVAGNPWFTNFPNACLNTLNTLLPLTANNGGVWVSLQNDGQGRLAYIDVTLEARYDRDKVVNSLTNPQINLHTKINPLGVGRQ